MVEQKMFSRSKEPVWSLVFDGTANFTQPAPQIQSKTLRDAITELLAVKTRANLSTAYLRSLRQYLRLFAWNRKELPIASISLDDLEAWFTSRNEAPVAQASNLGRLSSLFSYAVRRGYINSNPCDRMEKVRVDRPPPKILTVAEAHRLLEASRVHAPDLLAYLTLGLFCGIRPEECLHLTWQSLDLHGYRVRVDRAKTRRRRVVDIPSNALTWLAAAMSLAPERLCPRNTTLRRRRRLVAQKAGVEWSQDILRHTAASYMLARDKDAGAVAMQLGNSARILLTHYYAVVSASDAQRFFSLLPN